MHLFESVTQLVLRIAKTNPVALWIDVDRADERPSSCCII
jgi:hypothetical protein